MYKEHCLGQKQLLSSIPSSTAFYTVLEEKFSHIKFLKQTILGRCDFCLSIPDQKKNITNEVELEAFKEACRLHYQLHSTERLLYSDRIQTSQAHPNRLLHLVVDCPSDYNLPHIVPVTKSTGMLPKLPVHAVGVINHSQQLRDYSFFLSDYKKNPNLILTILFLHIQNHIEHNGHPPILWLQLDNCFKENKNRWMLAFAFWLIHIKWFQEVMISMLPPGHTHIDIDQMFSTLSIYMNTHSVYSLDDLVECLDKAYKKDITKPSGGFITEVYNFMGFFAPFVRDIAGISKPHVFLIRKQADGSIGMKVKKWHSSAEGWLGDVNNEMGWMNIMIDYPTGR
jgi:hypothetical protein